MAQWLVKSSGITPVFGAVPEGIEVSRRVKHGAAVYVLINFKKERQRVVLPKPMLSLLDEKEVSSIDLFPYGVAVLLDQMSLQKRN
jgi:beta-galactosidase GanA